MKKVLFIDRDGTIIKEPEDEQIDAIEKLEFLPYAISQIGKIARELEHELVMVTNQDGLGTESFPEDTFWPVQDLIIRTLEGEGAIFKEVLIDRSFPEEKSPGRKPGTAMLTHYMKGNYDLEHSYVIGDRLSDVQLADNLGAKSIYMGTDPQVDADLSSKDWRDIFSFLKGRGRIGQVHRKTKETNIHLKINLDGSGRSEIKTGIGFFDHMLEQISRHAELDLFIKVDGDLQVDEHHTIEDVGLSLGQAFREALGSKKGIERYGFVLPMDDALAQVALDFSGRPQMIWKADFTREMIGAMPTEMFPHFFKSFCDTALCNLNIKAEGSNEHHKIESIFKAFAKAIGKAVRRTDNGGIPSTKGQL